MRAMGCALDSCLVLALLVILAGICLTITIAYWRADGPLVALGVLALLVGIGWNSRPFKKDNDR